MQVLDKTLHASPEYNRCVHQSREYVTFNTQTASTDLKTALETLAVRRSANECRTREANDIANPLT